MSIGGKKVCTSDKYRKHPMLSTTVPLSSVPTTDTQTACHSRKASKNFPPLATDQHSVSVRLPHHQGNLIACAIAHLLQAPVLQECPFSGRRRCWSAETRGRGLAWCSWWPERHCPNSLPHLQPASNPSKVCATEVIACHLS